MVYIVVFLFFHFFFFFFFQAEDGIRDKLVTGVQTCALPIFPVPRLAASPSTPSGDTASRGTGSSGAGSYTRSGFSPVFNEERWTCNRTILPMSRITKSSKT